MTKVIENLLTDNEIKAISDSYVNNNHLFNDGLINSWHRMVHYAHWITKAYYFPTLDIRYVDYQPYENADIMRENVAKTNVLDISTQFNDAEGLSPIFGQNSDLNLVFRATHDMHHCLTSNCNFGMDGEICAFSKFAKCCLEYGHVYHDSNYQTMVKVLASEIIGQVAYSRHNGDFPEQVYNHCVPDSLIQRILEAYKVV